MTFIILLTSTVRILGQGFEPEDECSYGCDPGTTEIDKYIEPTTPTDVTIYDPTITTTSDQTITMTSEAPTQTTKPIIELNITTTQISLSVHEEYAAISVLSGVILCLGKFKSSW